MMEQDQGYHGYFEIHLIVRPEDQTALFAFYMSMEKDSAMFNVKPTCALSFYGDYPNQPMLTFWTSGTAEAATAKAREVSAQMTDQGIVVGRLKVEAAATAEKTPKTNGDNYYEFHFKTPLDSYAIRTGQTLMQCWEELRAVCLPHGSHLFLNSYSKINYVLPVVTLRRYDCTFLEAEQQCNNLIADIVAAGFPAPQKIQSEYSIIDTDVNYDRNWLFTGDQHNMKGLVSYCM